MSSVYRNILVAVDGSPDAEAALAHAGRSRAISAPG